MASMFPADVTSPHFQTNGEERFYGFLRDCARPDNEFLAWYEPRIGSLTPDFILYHRSVGLIIFEIKDWLLEQIVTANPQQFEIRQGHGTVWMKNPLAQARRYVFGVIDLLQRDGQLISSNPAHNGQPRIPVTAGVVFANIASHHYTQRNLHTVIDSDLILFDDDLGPYSPLVTDSTGKALRDTLAARFPPRFPFSLNANDQRHLRRLLFPEVHIRPARRQHDATLTGMAEQQQLIALLDRQQETLARQTLPGHHRIRGHSGTGKTLVLVHKAALMARYETRIERILLTCYNLTLARYIERLLTDLRSPIGNPGIEVLPFFSLCERLVGESVDHAVADGQAYYEILVEDALQRVQQAEQYDAILIDEGQDFTDNMLRVLVGLLNPQTNALTIAIDDNQTIYSRQRSCNKPPVRIGGRLHKLRIAYRSTRQINHLSDRLAGIDKPASSVQVDLFPDTPARDGPSPYLQQFDSADTLLCWLVERVQQQQDQGVPANEIAVLFLSRSLYGTEPTIPQNIRHRLRMHGIHTQWISQDTTTKSLYDITTESVTVSTVHSVKGLDYASVFLLGLDIDQQDSRWSPTELSRLAYVGITRARRNLFIPYVNTSPLIESLIEIRDELG